MASRRGQGLRFAESDVRPMGRTAAGVRGMKFRDGDELVSCDSVRDDTDVLVITSEGFGKRVAPSLFSVKKRGGLGVRCVTVNEKKGQVVGAMLVANDVEILLISSGGVIIRLPVDQVSQQGRDATGVSVMSLGDGEKVAAVARLLMVDDEEVADVDDTLETE